MVIMKKRLFCCAIVFLLLVAGCAELPTASYADGSPESSESAPESPGSEGESEASVSAPESSSAATLPPKEVTENTLRICVDINHISSGIESETKVAMDRILQLAAEKGGPTDVAVEYIPVSGSEREIKLESLRVELMSGEGPDLFILAGDAYGQGALFPMIEISMRSGVFLPLDTYIENAQFMEWDKLTPKVMEAGRTEEGQLVVPMAYTMPLTFYRKSEVSHTPSTEMTWDDMMADETGILRNAASTAYLEDGRLHGMDGDLQAFSGIAPLQSLGALADYDEKTLLFSEEELLQRAEEEFSLRFEIWEEALGDLPANRKEFMHPDYDFLWSPMLEEDVLLRDEATTMIPIYSDEGGVTATVTSFACINRNAKHAEEAFFILDLLMSREVQQEARQYKLYNLIGDLNLSIPMHMDLMQEEYPIDPEQGTWYMSAEDFDTFSTVRDQITAVRFRGGLETELYELEIAWMNIAGGGSDDSFEDVVASTYNAMEQMLSE